MRSKYAVQLVRKIIDGTVKSGRGIARERRRCPPLPGDWIEVRARKTFPPATQRFPGWKKCVLCPVVPPRNWWLKVIRTETKVVVKPS